MRPAVPFSCIWLLGASFAVALLTEVVGCPTDLPEAAVAQFQGLAVYGGKDARVEASGRISHWEGEILEFVAVETSGRTYESLLSLDCRPSGMQAALLLLGGKPHHQTGTRLLLELRWTADGQMQRVPVEEMLQQRSNRKVPRTLPWVFAGSQFVRLPGATGEVFLADQEEAMIGLYMHPGLLVQLAQDFGNPYRTPEAGFCPNTSRLPPKGTPITLILRIHQQTR